MSSSAGAPAPMPISAMVAATERDALVAAAHRLVESTRAVGYALPFRLNILPSLAPIDVTAPRSIVIASFLSHVFREETWWKTQTRGRARSSHSCSV